MRLLHAAIFFVLIVAPATVAANDKIAAQRSWKPFFTSFRTAVRKRDRAALRKMMSSDFFSSPGNDVGIEAAFQHWDDPHVGGWQSFNRVLNSGAVPMSAWWDQGAKPKYITRIAPPAANVRRNIDRTLIDWYAFFEFREGRWYCTIFSECCD